MSNVKQANRNTLSAILMYELSRLEALPMAARVQIATELTAAIQALRISQANTNGDSYQDQAAHYSGVKRATFQQKNQSENQVRFAIASVMYCRHEAYVIDGLQNELIVSTLNWVRDSITKVQK